MTLHFTDTDLPSETEKFSEEKIKPFRLVKYFTFTSLILIFLGTILLTVLDTYWVRRMFLNKSEEYALLLVENLNHQVFLQFALPVALKYGEIQLRNKEQFERMDKVVRNTLHSFNVDRINVYGTNNIVSYSFDKDVIGKENLGGPGYDTALSGKSTSRVIERGNFWEILFGFPKERKLVTFAPLRLEKQFSKITGHVIGVVEIEQDLSEDHKKISKLQKTIIPTIFIIMGGFFLVLRFVVKRGEGIMQKRAQERIRLKEELNRAKHLSVLGEMTAGISHEIRNPLGIITSSAELLRKKINGLDPSNKIPDIIIEEAGRLNHIITDFLNFAKPRSPNMIPCLISEIIEKNLTFLFPQFEEQQCSITQNYDQNIPHVMADSDMLYQAFLNILINSMQAMQNGGKIHIETGLADGKVFILFEDEGEGISDDALGKIWDPFFTTKEKGTGLGLGIVKNIIESHGGTIRAENRSVCGVRIVIELSVNQGI